jgi:hypothetical protein
MTNIASAKEGENQSKHFSHAESRPRDSVMWGNQGGFNMESITKGGAFRSVRGEQVGVKPTDLGVKRGPTVGSYFKDHENLKIEK